MGTHPHTVLLYLQQECTHHRALRFTWLPLTTCGFSLAFNNTIPHNTLACVPMSNLISIPLQPGHQYGGEAERLTNA